MLFQSGALFDSMNVCCVMAMASSPERRTTAMAETPEAVAGATIVSVPCGKPIV
jgi:ABC-type transporter Mla maintaining outer membrane lipid asymmetry ATPase subunit MlaF